MAGRTELQSNTGAWVGPTEALGLRSRELWSIAYPQEKHEMAVRLDALRLNQQLRLGPISVWGGTEERAV